MSSSRTFHNIIVENEMALKSPSNTALVWGRLVSPPHRDQGGTLMGVLGTKLLEALDNLLFYST